MKINVIKDHQQVKRDLYFNTQKDTVTKYENKKWYKNSHKSGGKK